MLQQVDPKRFAHRFAVKEIGSDRLVLNLNASERGAQHQLILIIISTARFQHFIVANLTQG